MSRRIILALQTKTFLLLGILVLACSGLSAQPKQLIHQPQTPVIIPGLRRDFHAELADLIVGTNPGWQAEESVDSTDQIYQLRLLDPSDSLREVLSVLIYPNVNRSSLDTSTWNSIKSSIRESYGNRGVPVRPLNEKIMSPSFADSTDVLAHYELLAKLPDYLEYIDAIVGKRSLVLVTAPIKVATYSQKIDYFRDIAEGVCLKRKK